MKFKINVFLLSLLIAGVFTIMFSACDKEDNPNPPDTDNNNNNPDPDPDPDPDPEPETCPATFVYDGYTYQIVEIGEQCWFAENLRYLPSVSGTLSSDTEKHYYVFGHNTTNLDAAKESELYQKYGALYNYPAALDICPEGWHLPTDAEWTTLTEYLGGESQAGAKMKKTGNEFWNDPNAGATNESGFNAIAGGYRANTGFYYHTSTQGYWWSATENTTTNSWLRILYFDRTMIGRDNYAKKIGLSVRCIKD